VLHSRRVCGSEEWRVSTSRCCCCLCPHALRSGWRRGLKCWSHASCRQSVEEPCGESQSSWLVLFLASTDVAGLLQFQCQHPAEHGVCMVGKNMQVQLVLTIQR
jgi:hypothetical protein